MSRFRELRKKANLTQEELIAQFNERYDKKYTAAAISQFEHDKRIPATESLKDFAEFFGVSVDYLLGLDSPAQKSADPPFLLDAREKALIANYRQLDDNGKAGVDHYIKFSLSEASTENVKEA